MTASSTTSPVVVSDLNDALDVLRDQGLRASAARRIVLQALLDAPGPVTAEDIAGGLEGRLPQSDLASTYRNLETLEAIGLVRHVHLGHGPGRYALPRADRREYVACDRCGAFEAYDPEALAPVREAVARLTGYTARFDHFPIVGICPACADGAHDEEVAHAHP